MAEIAVAKLTQPEDGASVIYKWAAVTEADTFESVVVPTYQDMSVQVGGTFGGATITIQGTLDPDEAEYSTLTSTDESSDLTFTAIGLQVILQNTHRIRPLISGGAGTSVDVFLLGARY
jgi:hypothetical protein